MCGIIAYNGELKIPITHIFKQAEKNEHRGDEDGFGYCDLANNDVVRTILKFEEIRDSKLDTLRKGKKEELEKLKARLPLIQKALTKETNFIIFHHRKASSGSVHIVNTHPIKVNNNIYYMQNGTIDGWWTLRCYLELFEKAKYNTWTDTEVIAKLIEDNLNKGKSAVKIFKLITTLAGIGVVIRVDTKNKEMLVFKDKDRSLYLYVNKNDYLLISEPLFEIKEFEKLYRLDDCVLKLTKDKYELLYGEMVDVKDVIVPYLNKEIGEFKCDKCDSHRTIRVKGTTHDYCLACLTSGNKLDGIDKEADKEDDKKKDNERKKRMLDWYRKNNINIETKVGSKRKDDFYSKHNTMHDNFRSSYGGYCGYYD